MKKNNLFVMAIQSLSNVTMIHQIVYQSLRINPISGVENYRTIQLLSHLHKKKNSHQIIQKLPHTENKIKNKIKNSNKKLSSLSLSHIYPMANSNHHQQ